jgi:tetratricopeptide (TPR) repeat protein
MSDKRKSAATKNVEGMSKQPVSKTAKPAESPRAASREGAVAVEQPLDGARQLAAFEAAMKFFHARKFQEAREQFLLATEGPERDVAQRATVHIAMCDRRLQQPAIHLETPEDYYNYGIALLNTRNIAEARKHLETALQMAPNADHIHYAVALAQALDGDTSAAYENLKRAIELEPRNRIIARQDADFAPLANQPPFDSLLYPEKKGW